MQDSTKRTNASQKVKHSLTIASDKGFTLNCDYEIAESTLGMKGVELLNVYWTITGKTHPILDQMNEGEKEAIVRACRKDHDKQLKIQGYGDFN